MLPLLKAKEARIMRVIKCVICVQTGHLCYEYKNNNNNKKGRVKTNFKIWKREEF